MNHSFLVLRLWHYDIDLRIFLLSIEMTVSECHSVSVQLRSSYILVQILLTTRLPFILEFECLKVRLMVAKLLMLLFDENFRSGSWFRSICLNLPNLLTFLCQ